MLRLCFLIAQADSFFRTRKRKRKQGAPQTSQHFKTENASNNTKNNNPSTSNNRSVHRRKLDFTDPNRKTERLACTSEVDYGVSSSGWQGLNFSSTPIGRALISEWENYTILHQLVSFTRVLYKR